MKERYNLTTIVDGRFLVSLVYICQKNECEILKSMRCASGDFTCILISPIYLGIYSTYCFVFVEMC